VANVIGQTLTRKKKAFDGFDSVRVVGRQGTAYVIAATEDYRPPKLVSEGELAASYGAKVADIETDAARMRRADAEATEAARQEYARFARSTTRTPDPTSPEGQFAALAAAEAEAATDAD